MMNIPEEDSSTSTTCDGPMGRLCGSGRHSANSARTENLSNLSTFQFHEDQRPWPGFLFLRVHRAANVDKDFRRVTCNRFYSVKAWIHPNQEYSTYFNRPDYLSYKLDPEWEEELKIPIGRETERVGDLKLHLEMVRAVRKCDAILIKDEPGPSNLRWVVGRVRMGLDGLEVDRWNTKILRLMQKDHDGGGSVLSTCWKPGEGLIMVQVKLRMHGI